MSRTSANNFSAATFWSVACALVGLGLAIGCIGCSVERADTSGGSGGAVRTITIDGSSTVYPITAGVSEEFSNSHPDVRVPVGTSGTGGGFKKFIEGVTDINDASRPIKDSETEQCQAKGIEFLELRVAIDGLTVVVNKSNDWCRVLTVAQLKQIWAPDSTVKKWSDVNPQWPDESIRLFGPGTDSGTFDYFTEEICGKVGASRSDYQQSEDDNFLVTGVENDKYSLGYFGYAYYVPHQSKINAVAIAPGDDASQGVLPTPETIIGGAYRPLSRPLFIYVNRQALSRPEVAEFLKYYVSDEGQKIVSDVKYVPLAPEQIAETRQTLETALKQAGGG